MATASNMMKKRTNNSNNVPHLFQTAELVLPWLSPPDLASISSTCKYLQTAAQSITKTRASDASRGFEKHPIPFFNHVDSKPYAYFLYTPFSISQSWGQTPPSSHSPHSNTQLKNFVLQKLGLFSKNGCACRGDCVSEEDVELVGNGCPCWDLNEVLNPVDVNGELGFRIECGCGCSCGSDCRNRVSQGGVSVRLKIVKDLRKGWGLHADHFIGRGEFVCEYAGELLTTEEARTRHQKYDRLALDGCFSYALLVVRENLPSGKASLRLNIDATNFGNVARFINHSCDGGNLSSTIVRSSGAILPRPCFFAARDIYEGEELTFSYGEVKHASKALPCFCGSSSCLGTLPSEQT